MTAADSLPSVMQFVPAPAYGAGSASTVAPTRARAMRRRCVQSRRTVTRLPSGRPTTTEPNTPPSAGAQEALPSTVASPTKRTPLSRRRTHVAAAGRERPAAQPGAAVGARVDSGGWSRRRARRRRRSRRGAASRPDRARRRASPGRAGERPAGRRRRVWTAGSARRSACRAMRAAAARAGSRADDAARSAAPSTRKVSPSEVTCTVLRSVTTTRTWRPSVGRELLRVGQRRERVEVAADHQQRHATRAAARRRAAPAARGAPGAASPGRPS